MINSGVQLLSPDLLPICEIQGDGLFSSYYGHTVTTQGIVFADLDTTGKKGFYLQEQNCDGDPYTSDGIFIYLGVKADVVESGDKIRVVGTVSEYYGLTEIITSPDFVFVESKENLLPETVNLYPPFDNESARHYFEARESMHVELDQAIVVGPTDQDDRTWLIRSDLNIARVYHDDPGGTGEIICVDDAGSFEITPEATVGEIVGNLRGTLDYSFGAYCMQLITEPIVSDQSPGDEQRIDHEFINFSTANFALSTFNLWNMFDIYDDPKREDSVLSPFEYNRKLGKIALAIQEELEEPALIALQEVENGTVLQDLISRPEINSDYDYVWMDGPDRRGLDTALLYRIDQIKLIEFALKQGCTDLVDGLGPDGNHLVNNPENLITCDINGDGTMDGNRLFSRPPLLVKVELCSPNCQVKRLDSSLNHTDEIWLIINHWKSKSEDTSTQSYTLARRIKQSEFVASIAEEILSIEPDANIVILGDLNDFSDSQPVENVIQAGFLNLLQDVEKGQRYTYVYQGVSQVLDHILVNLQFDFNHIMITPLHINADYPYAYVYSSGSIHRSSDHDPVIVKFEGKLRRYYLPFVKR